MVYRCHYCRDTGCRHCGHGWHGYKKNPFYRRHRRELLCPPQFFPEHPDAPPVNVQLVGCLNLCSPLVESIYPEGIQSEEAFGIPAVGLTTITLLPEGIGSTESFGSPVVQTPGNYSIELTTFGIASNETFGNPTVTGGAAPVDGFDLTIFAKTSGTTASTVSVSSPFIMICSMLGVPNSLSGTEDIGIAYAYHGGLNPVIQAGYHISFSLATSHSKSLAASVTIGNKIYVIIAARMTITSVTDNLGNTYALVNDTSTIGGASTQSIWKATVATGGVCTVTVHTAVNDYHHFAIVEVADSPPTAGEARASGVSASPSGGTVGFGWHPVFTIDHGGFWVAQIAS